MANRGELHSEELPAKNSLRKYFFNIKQDRHGALFVVLVESTQKKPSGYIRNEIHLYEEDILSFDNQLDATISTLLSIKRKQKETRDATKHDSHQ